MDRESPIADVFRLKLNPRGGDGDDAASFRYCRDKGVIGLGWAVDGLDDDHVPWEKYAKAWTETYPPSSSGLSNARRFKQMKLDSYCWIRHREDSRYFVVRVTGDWHYDTSLEARKVDIVNVRDAQWQPIDDEHTVPGAVIRSFAGRGRTFQAIRDRSTRLLSPAYSAQPCMGSELLQSLRRRGELDLWSLLDPWDYEDAVGVYLQAVRGFYVPPSYCHDKNTRDFEFFLVHPTDPTQRKVAVQVKSGRGVMFDCAKSESAARRANCDKLFVFNRGQNIGATEFTEILDPLAVAQFLHEARSAQLLTPRINWCLDLAAPAS